MSLKDITNLCVSDNYFKGVKKRKRLSDGTIKQYHYSKPRKQFEIVFSDESEKLAFEEKLNTLKKQYNLKTTKDVFEHLLSKSTNQSVKASTVAASSKKYESSKEKLIGNSKHGMFICEYKCILDLIDEVSAHHVTCVHPLLPAELSQTGHVAELKWKCEVGHILTWNSSTVLGKHYTINYRVMMAYLCSGMTPVQYERFCEFGDIGVLTDHFRIQSSLTFSAIISVLARESVQFALLDEVQLAKDKNDKGISIMTDARHHCRKNSYHTDHVALGLYSHKVINIQHITKQQERSTQKHETLGCEQMYRDFERHGVNVHIHTHDRNLSVNKAIRNKQIVQNCNERWHAAKPVSQGMKKICSGAQKNAGVTWHPELADKASRIRNHLYYALDTCGGNADTLRASLDNCVMHFQNIHDNCPGESECNIDGYIPDFIIVRSPVAVRLLTGFLHSLTIYKSAQDYVLSKDTFYVESFNNSCLVCLDKRIHYKETSYKTRINLAVLSWNEHVDRPFTSRYNKDGQDVHGIGAVDRNVDGVDHYDEESDNE